MDRTLISEHNLEGMRALRASLDAGDNWWDKERGKQRRAKGQLRRKMAARAASTTAAFAGAKSQQPRPKPDGGTTSDKGGVRWSNRLAPQAQPKARPEPEPEPKPEPEPEPEPEPKAAPARAAPTIAPLEAQATLLPPLPSGFARDITTPMTPAAASAKASSIAQEALQAHSDNSHVQQAARKLMDAEAAAARRHQG